MAQANKQTERKRERNQSQIDRLGEEKKESGIRKNGRKNYFISIKFNEKLHTAIAEGKAQQESRRKATSNKQKEY